MQTMHELCQPVVDEKDEGPTTSSQILGFVVDTKAMEIRLPYSKLAQLLATLKKRGEEEKPVK